MTPVEIVFTLPHGLTEEDVVVRHAISEFIQTIEGAHGGRVHANRYHPEDWNRVIAQDAHTALMRSLRGCTVCEGRGTHCRPDPKHLGYWLCSEMSAS